MYTYEFQSHKTLDKRTFVNLEEAIQSAFEDLNGDDAWPGRILDGNGNVMWEQSGWQTTRTTLEAFKTRILRPNDTHEC